MLSCYDPAQVGIKTHPSPTTPYSPSIMGYLDDYCAFLIKTSNQERTPPLTRNVSPASPSDTKPVSKNSCLRPQWGPTLLPGVQSRPKQAIEANRRRSLQIVSSVSKRKKQRAPSEHQRLRSDRRRQHHSKHGTVPMTRPTQDSHHDPPCSPAQKQTYLWQLPGRRASVA